VIGMTRALAIGGIALAAVLLLAFVGISQLTSSGSSNNQTDASVNVVLNGIEKVQGKRIAVTGDVKTMLAPYAVLLGSSDQSQVGLLVIAKDRVPKGVTMAAHVNASGTAKPFSLEAFRRGHPGVTTRDLKRSPLRQLDGHPAIVDARIAITPTS
jgi:hypothetical protein